MTSVLFVGESWSVTSTHTKGFDSFTTTAYSEGGGALLEALATDDFRVTYMPCHVAVTSFPATRQELSAYDAVVFSDIGSNSILLPAQTFLQGQRTPNRLELLREWVWDGGGFGMIGGYLSFQGIEGKANYRTSPIAAALPVEMEPGDDRIEVPEGVVPRVTGEGHLTAGLEPEWPALLGYQRLSPRQGATVLASLGEDPLLVTGAYGAGRSLAFASDIGEHWAPKPFTEWEGFGTLWRRSISWLGGA